MHLEHFRAGFEGIYIITEYTPEIARFLLEDAIFSSKTNHAVAARSRREVMAKLEIMKPFQRSFHLF